MVTHTGGNWELKEPKTNSFKITSDLDKKNKRGKRLCIAVVPFEEAWSDKYISNVGLKEQDVRRTKDVARANAKLIAEAGTVANECGLTPRQLLYQRNNLLEALLSVRLMEGMIEHNWDYRTKEYMPKVIKAIKKAE